MADVKFWYCTHCGNLFYTVEDGGVNPVCCGEPMVLLEANSTDAAGEKHVPVVTNDGERIEVNVGEIDHPMLDEHSIKWVAVVAENGDVQLRYLHPGMAPNVVFSSRDIKCGTAYAYCDLHGLWKTDFCFCE